MRALGLALLLTLPTLAQLAPERASMAFLLDLARKQDQRLFQLAIAHFDQDPVERTSSLVEGLRTLKGVRDYPKLGLEVEGALTRRAPRFYDDAFTCESPLDFTWTLAYPGLETPPTRSGPASQRMWLKSQASFQASLHRAGLAYEDLAWDLCPVRVRLQGREVPALLARGEGSILHVVQGLLDPGVPPPIRLGGCPLLRHRAMTCLSRSAREAEGAQGAEGLTRRGSGSPFGESLIARPTGSHSHLQSGPSVALCQLRPQG